MKMRIGEKGMQVPVVMDGYALPPEFTATFTQDNLGEVVLSLKITDDRRVICDRFEFRATEGHPEVTAADIRTFALSVWRDQAIQLAAAPVEVSDGTLAVSYPGTLDLGDRRAVNAVNKRRNRVNDESLRRVGELARQHPKTDKDRRDAAVSGDAYLAIQEEFEVTARTAQLWVKRARDKGFLK